MGVVNLSGRRDERGEGRGRGSGCRGRSWGLVELRVPKNLKKRVWREERLEGCSSKFLKLLSDVRLKVVEEGEGEKEGWEDEDESKEEAPSRCRFATVPRPETTNK